ncbi:hypothetical Protein YC6258_03038 [Gynuella sunshinyii YC6258]|uniref:Uncharacterized protein n=1 Tax=Gynuella sunshinyii YC6258 TaxID=1445510 RepID=A0A0C5VL94_9GAMM|nr:hypothetical Protein YC6258_03038 [Gynuella sunshinyii YC6258]
MQKITLLVDHTYFAINQETSPITRNSRPAKTIDVQGLKFEIHVQKKLNQLSQI